jgi:hypothetical protein
MSELQSGAGLRQSSVDAGARMAPGLANYKFSDPRDEFNQRDTLALKGRTPQQVDWNSPVSLSPAQIARNEEMSMLRQQLQKSSESSEALRSQGGGFFGATPSQDQLNTETANANASRQAQVDAGGESMARITKQREEQAQIRQLAAEQERLGLEAGNAQLRAVRDGTGPTDLNSKIQQTEAQARLAEAEGRLTQTNRERSIQQTRYNPEVAAESAKEVMSRVSGALFTNGILFGGRGNVDGSPWFRELPNDVRDIQMFDAATIRPLEAHAKVDPAGAARDAALMLSLMPPTRGDGQYGVSGMLLRSPDAVRLAESLNSIRARLTAIAQAQ